MRARYFVCVPVLLFSMFGCSGPTDAGSVITGGISGLIEGTSRRLTETGFVYFGSDNPEEAKRIALEVQSIVITNVLPYLDGATGISSAIVDAFLKQSFVHLPQIVKDIISTAAVILDQYVPIPGASALSANSISYIKAFFKGLSEGCADYAAGRSRSHRGKTLKLQSGQWLAFRKGE